MYILHETHRKENFNYNVIIIFLCEKSAEPCQDLLQKLSKIERILLSGSNANLNSQRFIFNCFLCVCVINYFCVGNDKYSVKKLPKTFYRDNFCFDFI